MMPDWDLVSGYVSDDLWDSDVVDSGYSASELEHHMADALSYHNPQRGRIYVSGRHGGPINVFNSDKAREDYFAEEELQPKFQQLKVSQVHGRTAKSICVSGVVIFDKPYRGMKQFEFLADWIPLSQCILTGNTARVPQWLIRSHWQQRTKRQSQFTDLADEAGRITRRRTY